MARKQRTTERKQYIGMAYCLPYVVVFLMGTIIPMCYALYLSLFKKQIVGGNRFVGLGNFIRSLGDYQLWESFGRVSGYFFIQVPLMLIASLVGALMLDSQRIRHVALPRILMFLPHAVP